VKRQIKGCIEHFASRFGPHRVGSGGPRLWVLMYHRILPRDDARFAREEPGMIVTPSTFRQQLRRLRELFEVMPLGEWVMRRETGKTLPARACAITFDDGWLDNYEFAYPILQQEQLPATLFAVADMIGTRRQFWPNRLARVLTEGGSSLHLPWLQRVGIELPVQRGPEQIAHIIDACKQMRDDELHALLGEAETELGLPAESQPALVDWDQLREMQGSGLIEIGSHTSNHFRLLDGLSESLLSGEIIASKHKLQAELGREITSFCYPNGDTSPAAEALVRQHYRTAVTTRRGINDRSTSSLALLRIGVHEDVSSTPRRFEARLSGWV
jgi:peptidoglycan/xylan/chitin deacetylase (PgdA/CDA1 family)